MVKKHAIKINIQNPKSISYYMPHHEVIKQDNETTKFRIVFDASASKPSLNESLYKGSADLLKLLD